MRTSELLALIVIAAGAAFGQMTVVNGASFAPGQADGARILRHDLRPKPMRADGRRRLDRAWTDCRPRWEAVPSR